MENSAQIDPSEPFYVIEIGSGHGKFGIYFDQARAHIYCQVINLIIF